MPSNGVSGETIGKDQDQPLAMESPANGTAAGSEGIPSKSAEQAEAGCADQSEQMLEPATSSEIWAWYFYDFANSPYYQTYLGSLFAIAAKWLAEEAAWQSYAAENGLEGVDHVKGVHPVKEHLLLPGIRISAGSFPLIMNVVACFFQIIGIVTFSPFGDYGGNRRKLLLGCSLVGSFFLLTHVFVFASSMWWWAGLVRVLGGTAFAMSLLFYDAYLPVIAAAHPDVIALQGQERTLKETEVVDHMSGRGLLIGYIGGMCTTIIALVVLLISECKDDDGKPGQVGKGEGRCSEFSKFFFPSLVVVIVGVWWMIGSILTIKRLKPRPGPNFPEGQNTLTFGWVETGKTICDLKSYRQCLVYVISFFVFSDSYNTITTIAPLIMESTEESALSDVLLLAIGAPFLGIIGIVFFSFVQRRTGLPAKKLILIQLIGFILVAIAGAARLVSTLEGIGLYLVFVPDLLLLGSVQAYSRSLMSELIPVNKEASFFAFYAIMDKGSNFIGTAVAAGIHNATGSYENAFFYVIAALIISFAVLYNVDVGQGLQDAGKVQPAEKAGD